MSVDVGSIGVWAPSWNWEGDESREAVAELDDLGYGALWLGGANGDLVQVSRLLDASERLVVATGIVNVWTHEPADLARAYRRVNATHPDRVVIGLGSSHAPPVEAAGHTYSKPYSRLVSFLDDLDGVDPTVPTDSLVLAALGPRTIELAGRRAAGAHPYLTTPEHTAWARELLGADAVLAPEQKVVLLDDTTEARELARDRVGPYLQLPNYLNNLRRLGFTEQDFAGGGSDRLVDAVVAWGDTDDVRRRVRQHFAAGASHVSLQVLSERSLPRQEWRRLAEALL